MPAKVCRRRTGEPVRRRTLRERNTSFWPLQNVEIRPRSRLLCKQAASTVFHVARRMMRNNEDAEDVVQESFQQAFIHLKSFNGDSRFSTWLTRIAINAALMKLAQEESPCGMCRSMNRPKPKSRLTGSMSKTLA